MLKDNELPQSAMPKCVAAGENLSPAIYETDISPLPGKWIAYLKKSPALNRQKIGEIFLFLEQKLPTHPGQLRLHLQEDAWGSRKIFRLLLSEVLAKGLAYRDLDAGQDLVPIPVILDNGEIRSIDFHLDRVPIPFANNSLFAYGLRPDKPKLHPPILLFRGTTPYPAADTMHDTLLADTCPKGPGWDVLFEGAGMQTLATWLFEATGDGENKALVIGHSLAGSLTQMITSHLPRFIGEGHAFNSPGVSRCTYELWEALSDKPSLLVFNRRQDLISLAGSRFAGEVFEVNATLSGWWITQARDMHNDCMFLQKEWQVFRVDPLVYSERGIRGYVHNTIERLLSIARPLFSFVLKRKKG